MMQTKRTPQAVQIDIQDEPLMVYSWEGTAKPALYFLHATGFHARCWDQIIHRLPDYPAYALDSRGHGQSVKSPPPISWHQMGADAAGIAQVLGLDRALGIGHSLGGNTLLRAAALVPDAFAGLLLIDPVVFPREKYILQSYDIDGHFVLNRRQNWDSWQEMRDRFTGRGSFAKWDDAILHDYCQYGLLSDDDGFTLACSPELEAHIYAAELLENNADIYDAIAKIQVPVWIMRCTTPKTDLNDFLSSPTAPNLAEQFANERDIPMPDNTHFIPMESPDEVANIIREFALEIASA